MIGASKIEKVNKTKFKKRDDRSDYAVPNEKKKKHHDKSFYRLMKEENDYGFTGYNSKRDS